MAGPFGPVWAGGVLKTWWRKRAGPGAKGGVSRKGLACFGRGCVKDLARLGRRCVKDLVAGLGCEGSALWCLCIDQVPQLLASKKAHPDLNQGPADLQSAALTTSQLSYVPT